MPAPPARCYLLDGDNAEVEFLLLPIAEGHVGVCGDVVDGHDVPKSIRELPTLGEPHTHLAKINLQDRVTIVPDGAEVDCVIQVLSAHDSLHFPEERGSWL